MFPSFCSPSSSPCPSPVREFAATLRRAGSPICGRSKYKSLQGPKEPMISKGRLTMTGGFGDLRPRDIYKTDSLESEGDTSSSSVLSSRSESCDSGDAILEPQGSAKPSHHYFKIPKRAFTTAMGHMSPKLGMSPKLSKKLHRGEESSQTPQYPMWPTVMATYGRGVSPSPVQVIMTPLEPSLTAMKAQAILDERRDIRAALQMLAYKAELQRQVESLTAAAMEELNLGVGSHDDDSFESDDSHESRDSHDEAADNNHEQDESADDNQTQAEAADYGQAQDEAGDSGPPTSTPEVPRALHEMFPINPAINVRCPDGRTDTPDEGFQEETLLSALDLEAVPTLTPEELMAVPINDVRNVHVVSDYVVLETAPPRESVFV